MKTYPILFTGEMVRAILDGRKTQTRRVVKPQPVSVDYYLHGERSDRLNGLPSMRDEEGRGWASCGPFRCPYLAEGMYAGEGGRLGNSSIKDTIDRRSRLWVRETWRMAKGLDSKSPSAVSTACEEANYRRPWAPIQYLADGATDNADTLKDFGGEWGKTRVSIHMPRWASRITLEVTSIRVERLQEISEADAIAEGCEKPEGFAIGPNFMRNVYKGVWEFINGAGSWDQNPWVWAVTFKRV